MIALKPNVQSFAGYDEALNRRLRERASSHLGFWTPRELQILAHHIWDNMGVPRKYLPAEHRGST